MSYEAPYAGLKVVDLSQGVAGPYCAMLLAQYGANVIKVEPTGNGDWSRGLGVRYGDNTAYSIPSNVGQTLDRAGPETGCRTRGAVATDRRRGRVLAGLPPRRHRAPGLRLQRGVGARAAHPLRAISGFGQTGPLAERPAMDPVLQAYTGLMAENKARMGFRTAFPSSRST